MRITYDAVFRRQKLEKVGIAIREPSQVHRNKEASERQPSAKAGTSVKQYHAFQAKLGRNGISNLN